MSRQLSLILGGAAQCTYLVGSAIPVLLMDRYGRRSLLMICSAGLCLCFVMVAILLSLGTQGAAYGATAFIFIFQLFYGVGWLPVSRPTLLVFSLQSLGRAKLSPDPSPIISFTLLGNVLRANISL